MSKIRLLQEGFDQGLHCIQKEITSQIDKNLVSLSQSSKTYVFEVFEDKMTKF